MTQGRHGAIMQQSLLKRFGLDAATLRGAIEYTHRVLDRIDGTLLDADGDRLASLVELANLSAIVGNLFRSGVSKNSRGAFTANRPHTFPDLLAVQPGFSDIEIKVALEANHPKGHLVKPGPHITVRYVLANERGEYRKTKSDRGVVVWIWEVRVGVLSDNHFNFSNTAGDSGKTAVINTSGMNALTPIFLDMDRCPYSPRGPIFRNLEGLCRQGVLLNGHSRDNP